MAVAENIGQLGLLVQEAFRADDGLRLLLERILNGSMREEAGSQIRAGMHERVGASGGVQLHLVSALIE